MPSLETANLTPGERHALERLVELLVTDFGDDLHGVWLYGSRARGEGHPDESDIDVLVITRGGRGDRDRVHALKSTVYEEFDEVMMKLSTHVQSPEWVDGRREIEAFFIQEVDRDKVVLHGSP